MGPRSAASSSANRPLLARAALNNGEDASRLVEETTVQTATGKIVVARQGDVSKPAIITYHDLALNYLVNFHVRSRRDTIFLFFPAAYLLLQFLTEFLNEGSLIHALPSLPFPAFGSADHTELSFPRNSVLPATQSCRDHFSAAAAN